MKKKEINKWLTKKIKPLTGNSRSFSNKAAKRLFRSNLQTFRIEGKVYKTTARNFRSYLAQLNK